MEFFEFDESFLGGDVVPVLDLKSASTNQCFAYLTQSGNKDQYVDYYNGVTQNSGNPRTSKCSNPYQQKSDASLNLTAPKSVNFGRIK